MQLSEFDTPLGNPATTPVRLEILTECLDLLPVDMRDGVWEDIENVFGNVTELDWTEFSDCTSWDWDLLMWALECHVDWVTRGMYSELYKDEEIGWFSDWQEE